MIKKKSLQNHLDKDKDNEYFNYLRQDICGIDLDKSRLFFWFLSIVENIIAGE